MLSVRLSIRIPLGASGGGEFKDNDTGSEIEWVGMPFLRKETYSLAIIDLFLSTKYFTK